MLYIFDLNNLNIFNMLWFILLQFVHTYTHFSWGLDILFNILQSSIYVLAIN